MCLSDVTHSEQATTQGITYSHRFLYSPVTQMSFIIGLVSQSLLTFKKYIPYCVHVCAVVHMWRPQDSCGDSASPSAMWDLGIDLRLQGLASKHLYWLSHLFHHPPTYCLLKSSCVFLRTPSLSMDKIGLVPMLQTHLLSLVPVLIGMMIIIQFIIQCSESITPQLSLIH